MYVARIRAERCAAFSDTIAGCKACDPLSCCSKGKQSSVKAQSARNLGCIVSVHASVSRMAVSCERIVSHRSLAHEDCK